MTECNQLSFEFHSLKAREVVGRFDGGTIPSDGGAMLLREVELRTGILKQFAACFTDHRDPDWIEHPLSQLIAQRVYGLALGYEYLNAHDPLRTDPFLAVLVNHTDPAGTKAASRSRSRQGACGQKHAESIGTDSR